jgi:hypothetical protein
VGSRARPTLPADTPLRADVLMLLAQALLNDAHAMVLQAGCLAPGAVQTQKLDEIQAKISDGRDKRRELVDATKYLRGRRS